MSDISAKQVLVCQNRTCRKQGSAEVLAALKAASVSNVTVEGTGCFGQCGRGPMVIVLPKEVGYNRVHPDEVSTILNEL